MKQRILAYVGLGGAIIATILVLSRWNRLTPANHISPQTDGRSTIISDPIPRPKERENSSPSERDSAASLTEIDALQRTVVSFWAAPLSKDDYSGFAVEIERMIQQLRGSEKDAKTVITAICDMMQTASGFHLKSKEPFTQDEVRRAIRFLRMSKFVEVSECPPEIRSAYLRLLDSLDQTHVRHPPLISEASIAMMILLGGKANEAGMGALSKEAAAQVALWPPEQHVWINNPYRKRIQRLGISQDTR